MSNNVRAHPISKVFGFIRLPANFGNISDEDLVARYQAACRNIPQDLGPRPVRANNSAGRQGAEQVALFLNDQLVYLEVLIKEICSLQEKLSAALGGFHTDEVDTYAISGFPTDGSLPVQLNPVAAYYLRVTARFRLAQVDFEFVSELVETILEAFGQVYRGEQYPAVDMSRKDLDDLATYWRTYESNYLALDLDFFKLSTGGYGQNTLFFKDQETVRHHDRLYGNAWVFPPAPSTNCFGRL
ncbi:hypothetical protein DHEL01_v203958 [Diaporthe helianthi]|uniref:Uncharacterized protein n=1 Tax=Diaporthe helianthi TaxID=158607 RepID=A0A2P5I574_DIAHE|nr:hypothetical protein DHEL01_v203958 [Diaporthe helianthi]